MDLHAEFCWLLLLVWLQSYFFEPLFAWRCYLVWLKHESHFQLLLLDTYWDVKEEDFSVDEGLMKVKIRDRCFLTDRNGTKHGWGFELRSCCRRVVNSWGVTLSSINCWTKTFTLRGVSCNNSRLKIEF